MTTTLSISSLSYTVLWAALVGISATASPVVHLKGRIESAGTPVAEAKVNLRLAGHTKHGPARIIATTFSDGNGAFQMNFLQRNRDEDDVLYVIAEVVR
jgi:hypothetical protein